MTVSRLWVERYRSLVDLQIDLFPVTVSFAAAGRFKTPWKTRSLPIVLRRSNGATTVDY